MPLPTSGALSLQAIAGEFGGSTPHGMSEYYAGGSNVPSGADGSNGPIPSSGALEIRDFYGAPIASANNNVTGAFNSRRGPDTDIFGAGNGATAGYEYTWPTGGYAYGSWQSGNDASDEGWIFWGCTLLQQFGGGRFGIVVHLSSGSWLNSRFSISVDGFNLDTNNAQNDSEVSLNSPGGSVLLRELYWDMGSSGEIWPEWTSGTKNISIARTG